MNQQLFINGQAKFPVSTEALDFFQQQILLTARLASIAGTNVIITPATTTADGLVVINGELLPLLAGTAKQYIQIIETKQSIVAGTQTFTDVRIIRFAQYANSGTPVSQFTTLDTIVRLMQRISAVEGTYMTGTAIRALVSAVQTNLNTTNSNLSSLQSTVNTILNNYMTRTNIEAALADNAKHHMPKCSVIDWYCADYICFDKVPDGFVPCGKVIIGTTNQFTASQLNTEIGKWRTRYPGISINSSTVSKNVNGIVVSFNYIQITRANSIDVPDLTDRFIVQAGYTFDKWETGGNANGKVTLTETNMPRHKHDVAVNNTGSNHQHRIAWPANGGGDANIAASNYIEQSGQGKSGNETYLLTHATASNYDGKHTHTVSETYKGNGTPFSILPPFYALYKLIKVI